MSNIVDRTFKVKKGSTKKGKSLETVYYIIIKGLVVKRKYKLLYHFLIINILT